MASSGTPRHSKKSRPGVTIDLAPVEAESVEETATPGPVAEIMSEEQPAAPVEPEASEPEPVPVPEQTAPAATARRLPGVVSGFLGGALALAGGAALQWAGVLPTFGNGADIAALKQEVSLLSEKSGAPALDPSIIEALKSGQASLSQSVETLGADISAAKETQKSLSDEIAALKSAGGTATGDSGALAQKLAEIETRLNGSDASAKLAEMESQITALKQSAGASTGAANVAQAIAAAGLKAAIDRGGAFANELETFATVAPASPELEQLKNLAAAGVPSKEDLSAEFGAVADAMLAATQTVDPNAGLLDRLTASAKSLVRSRPVGIIEGDTPEALVARMEVAMNKGDLDAALLEAGKLPDAARAAGIDYINKMTARRDTDALVTKALTSALSAAGAAK